MKILNKKAMFYGWGIDVKFEKGTPILVLPFIFLSNAFLFFAWFFNSITISIYLLFRKNERRRFINDNK